jgi:lysophospholipase L1-like esterase
MQKKTYIILLIFLIIIIAVLSNILSNNLDGKEIAFLGDSIMAGYGNNLQSFEYYFSKALPNSKLVNNSQSGSTISNNSGTDNIIMINQVKTLTGNPDIILFDGGANDIIDYAIGFLSKDLEKEIGEIDINSNEALNDNTVMADFEEIIIALKEKFPNAKLCYIQMFLIDDTTIDNITLDESKKPEIRQRRDKLYEQIEIACNKWNVSYIDVSDKFINTGTKYRQDDWIHLKEEGYQLLIHYVLEKLKALI